MKTQKLSKKIAFPIASLAVLAIMSISIPANAGGKCTGPKAESQSGLYCQCTNTSSCADKAGCGSSINISKVANVIGKIVSIFKK